MRVSQRCSGCHLTKYAVNEALESLDLEQVMSEEGVDFKVGWGRSGRQLNVRSCPFCGNNNHKVYINADTGLGNCFAGSCSQKTFNKWQWLKELYGLGARDLHLKIEFLAGLQGWMPKRARVPKFDPGVLLLPPCTPIRDLPALPAYLRDRGITVEQADYHDLRYCESGKFEVKTPTDTITQDYSKRIILPIYTLDGRLVTFQGRDTTGLSPKRYIFPPMFAGTGSQLYNIHNFVEGQHRHVVLTEGIFDTIATQRALRAGVHSNSIALCNFGMNFSISKVGQDDQMRRLMELKDRGLKTVTLLWDNEPAAIKAAIETALEIKRYGFFVYVALLGDAKDPGEATNRQIEMALRSAHIITNGLQAMMLLNSLGIPT